MPVAYLNKNTIHFDLNPNNANFGGIEDSPWQFKYRIIDPGMICLPKPPVRRIGTILKTLRGCSPSRDGERAVSAIPTFLSDHFLPSPKKSRVLEYHIDHRDLLKYSPANILLFCAIARGESRAVRRR